MSKKLTFQEPALTLQQYWNDQGCMLMQAYDNEKVREPWVRILSSVPLVLEPWNAA